MQNSRDNPAPIPAKGSKVGLPPRPFLYTLDQLAVLLDVEIQSVRNSYVHFEQRSIGVASRDQMIARNIAPQDEKPDWRVAEQELIRWMKRKGFKYYDRGFITY